jgi:hypothetical protein
MEVWDLAERRQLCALTSVQRWARFAPRRQWLITDTGNETTTIWQLPSGEPRWVFTNFRALPFRPTGTTFLPREQPFETLEGRGQ